MNIGQGEDYRFTTAARGTDGFSGTLLVRLLGADDRELARGEITGVAGDWNTTA